MNNRQTVILAVAAVGILAIVAIVGVLVSAPQPAQSPQQPTTTENTPKPSATELEAMLEDEVEAIADALTGAYPEAANLYTINKGKLYDRGQWYGTTLTYSGPDTDNRDTLRVLMEKKDNKWIVRTTPPQPLLSHVTYPEVPKAILQNINQPAELPGTDSSPAITQ